MTDTTQADDLATEWGMPSRALDQNDIDNLFGDTGRPAPEEPSRKRGFEALVGGALAGVGRLPTLNIVVDRLAQLMTASMRTFMADNADVNIDRAKAIRLGEFLETVTLPTMIAVLHIEQWDGYCLAALDSRHAAAFQNRKTVRCAVNQEFADNGSPVRPGDEVAFFPPVTGG